MTAINSNRAIRGPVTAVPVVAGKGVRLVADTENNRWVVEADETVLWEGTATGETSTASLSEVPTNFERIRVYWYDNDGASTYTCFEVPMAGFSSSVTTVKLGQVNAVANHWKGLYATLTNAGLLTVTQCSEKYILNTAAWTTGKTFTVTKVVGINRVASA